MNESVHRGMSPSVDGEKPIIDKNVRKGESLLLHLVVFSILLPAAAQSISAGALGLCFLFQRGWKQFDPSGPVPNTLRDLVKMLLPVWALLLAGGMIEFGIGRAGSDLVPYLRLIGKMGVFGIIVIASFVFYQYRLERSVLNPRIFLFFTTSLLIYALLQRFHGFDWVHGFHARLGANREAYGVFRVSGWMDHPLTFAFNLMTFALLSLGHAFYLRQRDFRESLFWALQALMLYGMLILTESRFPLVLTTGIATLGMAWAFPRLRKLLGGLAAIGVMAVTAAFIWLPRARLGRWGELVDPNLPWEQRFDRIIFWKVNWQLFKENPWFGTGLSRYNARLLDTYLQAGYTGLERKYNAHNIYLQALADGGLLGGTALVLFLLAIGRTAFALKHRLDHPAIILVFLGTLGGGLVQNHLRDTEYLFALWTSIGLCLSWAIVQGKRNEPRTGSHLQDL